MCKCTPNIKTPFCGKPGCEWPAQREQAPSKECYWLLETNWGPYIHYFGPQGGVRSRGGGHIGTEPHEFTRDVNRATLFSTKEDAEQFHQWMQANIRHSWLGWKVAEHEWVPPRAAPEPPDAQVAEARAALATYRNGIWNHKFAASRLAELLSGLVDRCSPQPPADELQAALNDASWLRRALVHACFALHRQPLHMLPPGMRLIDNDEVHVRVDGHWVVAKDPVPTKGENHG